MKINLLFVSILVHSCIYLWNLSDHVAQRIIVTCWDLFIFFNSLYICFVWNLAVCCTAHKCRIIFLLCFSSLVFNDEIWRGILIECTLHDLLHLFVAIMWLTTNKRVLQFIALATLFNSCFGKEIWLLELFGLESFITNCKGLTALRLPDLKVWCHLRDHLSHRLLVFFDLWDLLCSQLLLLGAQLSGICLSLISVALDLWRFKRHGALVLLLWGEKCLHTVFFNHRAPVGWQSHNT